MKLIDKKTGLEVKVGDTVTTFRGTSGVLTSFNDSRVYITTESGATAEFFLSVIDCDVVEN